MIELSDKMVYISVFVINYMYVIKEVLENFRLRLYNLCYLISKVFF